MGIPFEVKVEAKGFEEVEKEARLILNAKAVRETTEAVYADLKDALAEHIKADVYSPAVYTPEVYLRRSDPENRGFGTSLLESAEHAENIGPWDAGSGKILAGLRYEPTGEHANMEWSDPDIKPDELIGRIERKIPKYNFNPRKGEIPNRPFWQNFVEEMIEGGRFASTLDDILKRLGIAEPGDTITGVIRDSSDGNY